MEIVCFGVCNKELKKVRRRFQEIQEIDYFQSTRGEDTRALFQKAESLGAYKKKPETKARFKSRIIAAKPGLLALDPKSIGWVRPG
ncbi:MAG: hypothetical protein JOZ31_17210 [Verrucomicrobia bacterium]|nr:hypothetical protein [Verrucomicrobiota bacterium]MBV8484281.1 hypothetical protein [Verrucomicrobiota bacterium]